MTGFDILIAICLVLVMATASILIWAVYMLMKLEERMSRHGRRLDYLDRRLGYNSAAQTAIH